MSKIKEFIFSPSGILTVGILYGAGLVTLMWADEKRENKRVSKTFEEGIRVGMDLSRRGITEDDIYLMPLRPDKKCPSRMVVISKKDKKCNKKRDNGAKNDDSCTKSDATEDDKTNMVQPSVKEV